MIYYSSKLQTELAQTKHIETETEVSIFSSPPFEILVIAIDPYEIVFIERHVAAQGKRAVFPVIRSNYLRYHW